VLVADDVGVDSLPAYELGSELPSTPNIDLLVASGVRFQNAWSNPVCSPTRAAILTGRYGFRTGIGHVVGAFALSTKEVTLPEALDLQGSGYAHAAIGKWHLGNDVNGPLDPNLAGFSFFAGTLFNVTQGQGYFNWTQVQNGEAFAASGYVTAREAQDAIDWIGTAPEPWFCYVAFQAAHDPFHAPPFVPYGIDLSGAGDPKTNPRPFYNAMIEAMDHEIGRIVQSLGTKLADTTVLFVGDNGTPAKATVAPFLPSHAKGTLFQGGIRVPLIVAGAGVAAKGERCSALVDTTDLFATVLDLAGAKPLPVKSPSGPAGGPAGAFQPGLGLPTAVVGDSVSLVPYLTDPDLPSIRTFAFAESFRPLGFGPYTETHRAIRGARYKLIVDWPAPATPESGAPQPIERLFDLQSDPFELDDLLLHPTLTAAQEKALTALRDRLAALLSSGPPSTTDVAR
jgi:arylsulfatase A-like enzyme